jgi:hypothetical protein
LPRPWRTVSRVIPEENSNGQEFCSFAPHSATSNSFTKAQDFSMNFEEKEFCPFDAILPYGVNIQIPRAPEARSRK